MEPDYTDTGAEYTETENLRGEIYRVRQLWEFSLHKERPSIYYRQKVRGIEYHVRDMVECGELPRIRLFYLHEGLKRQALTYGEIDGIMFPLNDRSPHLFQMNYRHSLFMNCSDKLARLGTSSDENDINWAFYTVTTMEDQVDLMCALAGNTPIEYHDSTKRDVELDTEVLRDRLYNRFHDTHTLINCIWRPPARDRESSFMYTYSGPRQNSGAYVPFVSRSVYFQKHRKYVFEYLKRVSRFDHGEWLAYNMYEFGLDNVNTKYRYTEEEMCIIVNSAMVVNWRNAFMHMYDIYNQEHGYPAKETMFELARGTYMVKGRLYEKFIEKDIRITAKLHGNLAHEFMLYLAECSKSIDGRPKADIVDLRMVFGITSYSAVQIYKYLEHAPWFNKLMREFEKTALQPEGYTGKECDYKYAFWIEEIRRCTETATFLFSNLRIADAPKWLIGGSGESWFRYHFPNVWHEENIKRKSERCDKHPKASRFNKHVSKLIRGSKVKPRASKRHKYQPHLC